MRVNITTPMHHDLMGQLRTTTAGIFANHPMSHSDIPPAEEVQSPLRKMEYAILVCISTVGLIGNTGIMAVILLVRSLRKSSNAFIFHHCVLDFLKALYCRVFANSILTGKEPMFCNLLGGSFIVCVTSTAFNILAMVMNEAYVFADLNSGIKDSGNYCCVVFSISTIWFASIILNLGVAFLPGNPSFITGVGHCTFDYGITRNYVLHILWIILVTLAVGLTSMYLRKLYSDIRNNQYTRLTKVVRASISIDPDHGLDAPIDDAAERSILKKVERYSLRKLYTLVFMISIFILFWYPLFMLTILDRNFKAPPSAYKILTIFACSNSAVNPFVFICLIKRRCCCRYELPALPLAVGDKEIAHPVVATDDVDDILHSSNRYSRYLASDDTASGIYNEFYQRSDPQSRGESFDHSPSMEIAHEQISTRASKGLWSTTTAITSSL